MITVYVIESMQDQTWYTGMSKDVINQLKEHNSGKNRFTKGLTFDLSGGRVTY
ncbi:MAG TPA: GIY-YIG nuclease family protein [Chitinophagaceae bacterium]|nr:GIY-YIG nuclease family protein [Chitinophagaceae bacterium]